MSVILVRKGKGAVGYAKKTARNNVPPPQSGASETYARIYAVVKKIPRGRVATYGQIATLAGIPRHARQVGYALHALRENAKIPWQRVINAKGEVSTRVWSENHLLQRLLLEAEGVEFDLSGRVALARFGWKPR